MNLYNPVFLGPVTLLVGSSDLNLLESIRMNIEELKTKLADLSQKQTDILTVVTKVGAENYVIHSGLAPRQQGDGIEAAYGRQREWLAKAGDVARQHGLYLCVETLFAGFDGRGYASTPLRLARELERLKSTYVNPAVVAAHDALRVLGQPIEREYPLVDLLRRPKQLKVGAVYGPRWDPEVEEEVLYQWNGRDFDRIAPWRR